MTNMESLDGYVWRESVPEPLWYGWRLRKARCQCGAKFKGRYDYYVHWRAVHATPGRHL